MMRTGKAVRAHGRAAYPIEGFLSGVTCGVDPDGRPFLHGRLEFRSAAGRPDEVTAFAIGRAVALAGRDFTNGETRLYGMFDEGVFHVVQNAARMSPGGGIADGGRGTGSRGPTRGRQNAMLTETVERVRRDPRVRKSMARHAPAG